MKTLNLNVFLGVFAVVVLFSGCSKDDDLDQSFYDASSKNPSENLTSQELQGLLYIAEKQKLHSDIYLAMSERSSLALFSELYVAEEKNLELVTETIEFYGQESPVLNKVEGYFKLKEVQAVYDEFKNSVGNNLFEMLDFALGMEESTMREIQEIMEDLDGNTDIRNLYTELVKGSSSHVYRLDAEVKNLLDDYYPAPIVDEM